jgi:hypothetical protein
MYWQARGKLVLVDLNGLARRSPSALVALPVATAAASYILPDLPDLESFGLTYVGHWSSSSQKKYSLRFKI